MRRPHHLNPRMLWTAVLFFLFILTGSNVLASETLCARVKIEIKQELTLERQAFDAHMKINNGLEGITLENVDIDVSFKDENGNPVLATSDPDNTEALFFIRVDTMENIDNVSGIGTVAPSTSADIHWMIIPAPGASNGLESGTLYYVGATLRYTIGGEENITEVSPDYIYVKPMPNLILDYFLPKDVYGDDPLTEPIEEIVPFSLGVRVSNAGHGAARNLKIDSAQPKIVENEQGLLIGFILEGSQVEGEEVKQDLLVDFGDIPSNDSKMARWVMTCSLSGIFKEFTADYSHSGELGGEVTSLIEAVNTHFLVKEVVTDLPGRDTVWDYLAKDGDVYRVYESNSTNTDVTDQSSFAALQPTGTTNRYTLTAPSTAGFMLVQLSDPGNGKMLIKSAVRSDGKIIRDDNVWFSKTRDAEKKWVYHFSLFDVNTTGSYTIDFEDASLMPQPPNIQFIQDRTGVETHQISFVIQASDPNGEPVTLSASPLPAGAVFTDQGGGEAVFDWTPSAGQSGRYTITVTASDGDLKETRSFALTINSLDDTDGDGMNDTWETIHFGNLYRDGTGDFDGDGISDIDEYLMGTNPEAEEFVPGIPTIAAPMDGDEVNNLTPSLTINNSINPSGGVLSYEFQLFSDKDFYHQVTDPVIVSETQATTTWNITTKLLDNTYYYWRVRAVSGGVKTLWAYGFFFVNTANDAPGVFNLSYPSAGKSVDTERPVLQITNSVDPDDDQVTYRFDIYSNPEMTTHVTSSSDINGGSDGTTSWISGTTEPLGNGTTYYWKVTATDEHGLTTESDAGSFTVDLSNSAPVAPAIESPGMYTTIADTSAILTVTNSTDADSVTLSYYFELDVVNTFNSPLKKTSGSIDEGVATTAWTVEGLQENTDYYWRVKASDTMAESAWTTGVFSVDTINEAPLAPVLENPGRNAWITNSTVTLSAHRASDPEDDGLTYSYEVYTDENLSTLVAQTTGVGNYWTVPVKLTDNTRYFWRVLAVDQAGAVSEWTETAYFFVKKSKIPETLQLSISTSGGIPISGVTVYAFTGVGSYTGLSSVTDDTGVTRFNPGEFNEGSYTFRVSYMGKQFWTDVVTIPGTYKLDLVIQEADTNLTVTTAAGAASGIRVYLFSESGAYLGQWYETGENGQISVTLPVDTTFKFRADMSGHQYWSDVCQVTSAGPNSFTVMAGGGRFTITLQEEAGVPMEGIRIYLFKNTGSYLSQYNVTDVSGTVSFDVPEGTYKVRADYLGYQFWSLETNVTKDTPIDLTIAHSDFAVTISGIYRKEVRAVEGIRVYLFSETGSYMSINSTTDVNGQVVFRLPNKAYKVRADYMGSQFWSAPFTFEDATVDIPMGDADVRVGWSDFNLEGVRVYAFTGNGSYLNLNSVTGVDGISVFRLPAERTYKFRADYQYSQFWSTDVTLVGGQANPVDISTGGGTFVYTVDKGLGTPLEGVKTHVFSENGSYFGVYGPTNSDGTVSFDLADGTYNIRTDYLGYQFWSPVYSVPDTLAELFTIMHSDVIVSVKGVYGATSQPISGVPVYLFTPAGSYVSMTDTTDTVGQVTFNLPEKPYKVRADYMGQQFWSEEFTGLDTDVNILMADAEINVTWDGQPLEGVSVYAFTPHNSYLNRNTKTDVNGKAVFRLPAGIYKFRADYLGSQFWSEDTQLVEAQVNTIDISTGGGPFVFTVMKNFETPLTGAKCYVFSETGSYLNLQASTSSEGQVAFDLAQGNYKFRIDYMGYQFWSGVYPIPGTLSDTFTINHQDVILTVNRKINETISPLPDANVYLFTPSGAYQNLNKTTDANGQVVFNLPAQPYKVRVDYMSGQFWSDTFTQKDTPVNIPMADAVIHVTGAGQDLDGVKVYAFNANGSYLSMNAVTDVNGIATFRIPAGTCKFRADYQGGQFWSNVTDLIADQLNPVDIDTGGGAFTLTLKKSDSEIMEGVRCYVYTETGSYIGLFADTDASGNVSFTLSDGTYKFRADHLGYQFWTDVFSVPGTLSSAFLIPHTNVTVSVQGDYQGFAPVSGANVYLYSESGAYMNTNLMTDGTGQVVFSIPPKNYQARVDYLGYQFWSNIFSVTDTMVTINEGEAEIHVQRAGLDVEGAVVYLFTEGGAYMNRTETTGIDGTVQFVIPDRSYKFRVNEGGNQYWTDPVTVIPGIKSTIGVTLE